MKVEKDGIIKEVSNEIAPDYITAGWKEAKETKKDKPNNKENNNTEMK